MGQITRLKDSVGGSIYPLTTSDAVYVGGITLSAKFNNLTKSDVGLGNVSNQTITVTESSVSNGSVTFNKYTHPDTAGNKHIPANGSAGQFLKYGGSSGTATWASIGINNVGISIDNSDKTITFGASDIFRCAPNPEEVDKGRFLKCGSDGNICYADLPMASNFMDGMLSSEDYEKLESIEDGANAYVHPDTAGNKHIPAGGSSGQFLKYSSAGTATWASLSKSDVGLGNVSNQTITVTSSSVTDGTNTFTKYTHPTTAGNKHIPSSGSTGQYLKYGGTSGTAEWASFTTVTGSAMGMAPPPSVKGGVNNTQTTSSYYIFATSAAGQTPGWYKLPDSVFNAVSGSADGIVKSTIAGNLTSTEATSSYYIFATAGSGQNPHWYKLPSTAFTTLTNDYNDSSNTATTALSALGAYNMYNEIQGTLGEISSLLDSI